MRPALSRFTWLAFAGLILAGLAGCRTLHGWAQLGSNHPAQAGASVRLPLGR
ncbi:MAG: hypothetical protein WCL24_14620 [Verrucomicrobiota bacterium]